MEIGTVNRNPYSSMGREESSQRIEREPASKWNYFVPIVAGVAWFGFWGGFGNNMYYQWHDYINSKVTDPDIIELNHRIMIKSSIIGAATIPLSFVAAALRGDYHGCLSNRVTVVIREVSETIQEACSPSNFSKPEGIIINTLAVPVLMPVFVCWACLKSNSRS